ncbi:MAG: BlaI/MecI/CopY family transcriptional regulator [Ralstonia sp.]
MPKTPKNVTDAELAVLETLWDADAGATIRQLTARLYPRGGTAHYATVQKLLERLEAKRYVRRSRSRPAHRFTAQVGREEFIGRQLEAMARKLCGGSMTPLLTHLVQTQRLSAEERRRLRRLLDQLEREANRK